MADFGVKIPDGVDLSGETGPGSKKFDEYEKIGMQNFGGLGFVLVAGGLGERLGYPGIKIELPTEMTTEMCFLELYCKYILAIQGYARANNGVNKMDEYPVNDTLLLPLCIMTSGDTHEKTMALLEKNNNFGLKKEQLFIMQQDKVPAFSDENCRFVLDTEGKKSIETKPHGHGDVHILMYMEGVAKTWLEKFNLRHIIFFQDTNPLAFRALASCLGVSVKHDFAMNSLAVPRKAKEAAGAIVGLDRKVPLDPKDQAEGVNGLPNSLVMNVEYCHLGGLLVRN